MAAEPRLYWIQMDKDFLESRDIRRLREIEGGAVYVLIYLKLILKTIESHGIIIIREGDDLIDEVALMLGEARNNVEFTLRYLERYGLIKILDINKIEVQYTVNHLESVAASTIRSRKSRANKAKAEALQRNTDATLLQQNCNTDKDKETDKDKQQQQHRDATLLQQNCNAGIPAGIPAGDCDVDAVAGRTELGDEEQAVLAVITAEPWNITDGKAAELIMAHGAGRCGAFEIKYRAQALRGEVGAGLLIRLIENPNEPTPTPTSAGATATKESAEVAAARAALEKEYKSMILKRGN